MSEQQEGQRDRRWTEGWTVEKGQWVSGSGSAANLKDVERALLRPPADGRRAPEGPLFALRVSRDGLVLSEGHDLPLRDDVLQISLRASERHPAQHRHRLERVLHSTDSHSGIHVTQWCTPSTTFMCTL